MSEILLVNPKSRKKRKSRRRNPITGRRRSKSRGRRANPRRRRMRALRRRNPISLKVNKSDLMAAGGGAITAAIGAVALDALWSNLPIPAQLKAGNLQLLAKGAGAVGLGVLARNVVSRKTADMFTLGALTVIVYQAGRSFVQKAMPQLKLGYYSPGFISDEPGMGAYMAAGGDSFPVGGRGACPTQRALPAPAKSAAMHGFEDGIDDMEDPDYSY